MYPFHKRSFHVYKYDVLLYKSTTDKYLEVLRSKDKRECYIQKLDLSYDMVFIDLFFFVQHISKGYINVCFYVFCSAKNKSNKYATIANEAPKQHHIF